MGDLLSAAVVAYGHEIIHSAVGIDDICKGRYFVESLGITIRRWSF